MTDRRLVVNGDDFGLTPGVNAGIVDAHTRGILTSASVFANAGATLDAIALARNTPTLGVGCHLTLVDGAPLLPAARVPTLAPEGVFHPTWGEFIAAALSRRIALDEVERELEAQIDRVRSAGIHLTHLDSHKHVHAYPPVFRVVARLARRFGIRAVRVPYEEPSVRWLARTAFAPAGRRQAIENAALAPWCAYDRRILVQERLPAAPRFLGRVLTGLFTPDSMTAVIQSAGVGANELMTHPGYVDSELSGVRTRLRAARQAEVAALVDPRVRDVVRSARIALQRHDGRQSFLEPQSHAS